MKNLTIESAEKMRYKMILWIAIAWPFLYLPPIYTPLIESRAVKITLSLLAIIGGIITFAAILKLVKLVFALKKRPDIAYALSGEMNLFYHRKTLAVSLYTVWLLLVMAAPILRIYPMPAYRACMLLFFISLLQYCVTWLIYNRE